MNMRRKSAVKWTHLPSGISAVAEADRDVRLPGVSTIAKKLLAARVWASTQERPKGNRRSYVCCPYQAVKDHRNGQVLMEDPARFLSGDLDPLLRLALKEARP